MTIDSIFAIIILIFSAILHEVSHGWAALALGDPTAKYQGRLSLNPIKHLDPFGSVILPALLILVGSGFVFGWAKPVPYNPYNLKNQKWGPAIVAGAGPLMNILVALVFGLILRYSVSAGLATDAFLSIVSLIVFINILLAVFNLVPIPPLDGSKIIFTFIPFRFSRFVEGFEAYSMILLLIFIFFLWQYVFPVIFYIFHLITGVSLAGL